MKLEFGDKAIIELGPMQSDTIDKDWNFLICFNNQKPMNILCKFEEISFLVERTVTSFVLAHYICSYFTIHHT